VGEPYDVIVVGGGVIGLAVAWRCAQRGLGVAVVDPAPGSGASRTAAGMLAPVTELHYEGAELLALNVESARRYPDFAAELTTTTGIDIGYRECGTVQVAWDAADLAELRALHEFQATLGVASRLLTGGELRDAEPALAAGLPGGLYAAGDHQVDNRRLHAALLAAAATAGVELIEDRVAEVEIRGDAVAGALLAGGARMAAGTVVIAAGAWSRQIGGLPPAAAPLVRPVKGQTVRLRGPADLLRHVVRGAVRGSPVYLVPRADGEIVLGASSEEAGFDTRPRAGAVYELLRNAQTLVPELGEVEFVEVSTGLRPGSPDNAPLLGPGALQGLVLATGHYRNGILLAPVTGDEIATLLVDGRVTPAIAAFDPRRDRTEALR
jgi:glycine oxidase